MYISRQFKQAIAPIQGGRGEGMKHDIITSDILMKVNIKIAHFFFTDVVHLGKLLNFYP